MALSLTHFPETTTTFAILYGCTNRIEKSMIDMLSKVTTDVCHPMVVPGIFAELELARHIGLVDAGISDVETKIFELNTDPAATRTIGQAAIERKNEAKRTSWLDLAYLRNAIITWNYQLTKMSLEAARPNRTNSSISADVVSSDHIVRTGNKIAGRLVAIHEEYEEKIRDCTMRLDGMAMATQWVTIHILSDLWNVVLISSVTQWNSCRNGFGHKLGIQSYEVNIFGNHGLSARDFLCRKSYPPPFAEQLLISLRRSFQFHFSTGLEVTARLKCPVIFGYMLLPLCALHSWRLACGISLSSIIALTKSQ